MIDSTMEDNQSEINKNVDNESIDKETASTNGSISTYQRHAPEGDESYDMEIRQSNTSLNDYPEIIQDTNIVEKSNVKSEIDFEYISSEMHLNKKSYISGSMANIGKITGIPSERKDLLYKIIVIGDLGSGKTSIIKRYVHRFFTHHYRATVGVDFALKVLNWDEKTLIRLQLWDIAGQERFGNMTRVYYKEAVGAFIVFDVTRITTFESVAKWKSDLDSKVHFSDGSPIPCVLLANKCDQPKEGLVTNPNKMNEYCKEYGFSAWFETSAKENVNIDEAAHKLVSTILESTALLHADDLHDEEKLILNSDTSKREKFQKNCAC